MSEIVLKIEEIPQQHVGKGRAIVDPKIIEDEKWETVIDFTTIKKGGVDIDDILTRL